MNIILYLATKYLKFKSSDRGLSRIAIIAFLTIVISSGAAVVILSAANGFHNNIRDNVMHKDAHIIVLGPGKGISDYEDYIEDISQIPGVEAVIPYFDRQALIKGRLNTWGSLIKAYPKKFYETDKIFKDKFKIIDGELDFSEPHSIVLGENLAMNLGATVGSWVYLTVYSEEYFSIQYKFQVAGLFTAGYAEYDANLSFITFEDAQEIFDAYGYAYGLALRVKKPMKVEEYMPKISKVCPYQKWHWKSLNRNNLIALENEKMLMQIILAFFFVVVSFNMLSTMIAMVLDKKQEIGILKAMGLKPGEALHVFLFDGFLIGNLGSALGIIFGLLITNTLNTILKGFEYIIDAVNWSAFYIANLFRPIPPPTHFEFFKSSVYYINEFPLDVQFFDIMFVIILSVVVSTLAVIIPAWKASKLRPVEVLRND